MTQEWKAPTIVPESLKVRYVHSKCHESSPTWCRMDHGKGTISVHCAECDLHIVTYKIYPFTPDPNNPDRTHYIVTC